MLTDAAKMFDLGALHLAKHAGEHNTVVQDAGITQQEWEILTKQDLWNRTEARAVPEILASVIGACLTYAGLPSVPLPAQYVACVICRLVHPCNRYTAAMRSPRAFDAVSTEGHALGGQEVEVEDVSKQRMIALVTAYSSGHVFNDSVSDIGPQVQAHLDQQKKKEEKPTRARN